MYDSFALSLAINVLPCAVADNKKKESVQKFLNPALRGTMEAVSTKTGFPCIYKMVDPRIIQGRGDTFPLA